MLMQGVPLAMSGTPCSLLKGSSAAVFGDLEGRRKNDKRSTCDFVGT
ncbi:hypothetical protein COLINT_03713 [Collinsella intestinalis DSM 13280]|uniref:Uncharacterized protein n=1 Tax=Collinsella intestinalis DSM 13280 TaxID=521003 RepID=C4FC93_9ACTN|nr:hypothetical protein COLINT_03713 [Collinsella intestinalis DSM 13280]